MINNTTSSSGGGEGGPCFIVTAAFNTPMAQEVRTLCRFRDKYLLTNNYGIWFIKFYYYYSPPIADYIRNKELIKKVIRTALHPLIMISHYLVNK